MSKSRGNVVNPDEMVERFGADAFRLYEMFMGAFDQHIPWATQGLVGMSRFLERVWNMQEKVASADSSQQASPVPRLLHRTIKQVGERVEAMKFNTAIAALMTLANHFGALERIRRDHWETFVLLLSPFAPHVAEELWARSARQAGVSRPARLGQSLGHEKSLAYEPWPTYDEAMLREEEIEIAIQVNGKVRSRVRVPADAGEDEVRKKALSEESIRKHLEGKKVLKVIVVAGKLVNIVAQAEG
jgi:leucyl-tRNA synthetase